MGKWNLCVWQRNIDLACTLDLKRVSVECLAAIERAEQRRGVDLPTWRLPAELLEIANNPDPRD